jgi:geranylgeranyl diphosphate synthase type II
MEKKIEILLEKVNAGLENLSFPNSPANLYEPIQYILQRGGKRIRPLLAMLAYKLYKKKVF